MMYMHMCRHSALRKILSIITLLALYVPHTVADILYEIEPCCTLCLEVNDDASYNTEFLKTSQQLVEGREGWLYRSRLDLMEKFGLNRLTMKELGRFRAALVDKGAELLLVYQPTRGLIHPEGLLNSSNELYDFNLAFTSYKRALQQIRRTGIIVPDFPKLIDKGDNPEFYFRRDAHWTPYGAMLTAQVVADTIKKLDLYPLLPKKSFTTHRTGLLGVNGSHQKAAYLICGTQSPPQYVDEFATEPTEESESDLFGDSNLPQVVAAGTSFTNAKYNYNFVGYLKEFLFTDILNIGLAGGGAIGSLLQYLPSEDFQADPPKLLIWEVPSYTSLSSSYSYRQLVPLVYNGCKDKTSVLSRTSKLRNGVNELLFNGGGEVKSLQSGDYLLDVQFSDPNIKRLNATVWYHNSRKERIKIKHRDRVDTQGRFVFELRSNDEWKDLIFISLDLEIDDSYPADLKATATMCQRDYN